MILEWTEASLARRYNATLSYWRQLLHSQKLMTFLQHIFNYVALQQATGEPCLLMGYSAMLALRNAINAAKFGTDPPTWFQLGELCYSMSINILLHMNCLNNNKYFQMVLQ